MDNNSINIFEKLPRTTCKIEYRYENRQDSSIEPEGSKPILDKINGASVIPSETLMYNIVHKHSDYSVNEITFTMPDDNAKLSSVFSELPYGLIKKNRTGVGATTLELNSKRNSIIVVPTRALAYEKAKNSKIANTDKYSILYVGSRITGFTVQSIEEYTNDTSIPYKKFMVVVDSLPRLLDRLGESSYSDYFIMFDEIDSYQYDSWYRPNMEKAIEYYFKFPYKNRCLVSATIGEFCNPKIQSEPVINVKFNNPYPRRIIAKPTSDVNIRVLKTIEEISQNYPNEKILVAFNLVTRGILKIILSLSDELRSECSVLCGEKSRKHVEQYYREILSNQLPSRITFMSCTYFVGIDIDEPFHLISVSDCNYPFTLLSPNKLQQIAGRCRVERGLLSETIIYSINEDIQDNVPRRWIESKILAEVQSLLDLAQSIEKVKDSFPKIIRKYNEIFLDEIIQSSAKSYCRSYPVKVVRDSEGNLAPAYFNIDNILIQIQLLHSLYSTVNALPDSLIELGHDVSVEDVKIETEHISDEITAEIIQLRENNDTAQLRSIIDELRTKGSLQEKRSLAQARRNGASNFVGVFLEHFLELMNTVPFEELVRVLPDYDTPAKYKHLKNAVIFWALNPTHPVKIAISSSFICDSTYTGEDITGLFNNVWDGALGLGSKSPKQAIPLIRKYFATLETTSVRVDGLSHPQRRYKIINLNPLGIVGDPVVFIASDFNIQRHIKE
jgi:hypothetical protein